jgi:hypothetical protein
MAAQSRPRSPGTRVFGTTFRGRKSETKACSSGRGECRRRGTSCGICRQLETSKKRGQNRAKTRFVIISPLPSLAFISTKYKFQLSSDIVTGLTYTTVRPSLLQMNISHPYHDWCHSRQLRTHIGKTVRRHENAWYLGHL